MDSTLSNWDVLQDILGKVPFSVGGRAVDLKSVKLSGKTTTATTATATATTTTTTNIDDFIDLMINGFIK